MAKGKTLSLALVWCLAMTTPSVANSSTFTVRVADTSVSCLNRSGKPVRIVANHNLGTLGRAFNDANGTPTIEMNFGMLNTFSPVLQKWWFAHECAHHQLPPQLNSERRADCLAARQLPKLAGANIPLAAASIGQELSNLPGSTSGHLPGPDRAKLVLKCAGISAAA